MDRNLVVLVCSDEAGGRIPLDMTEEFLGNPRPRHVNVRTARDCRYDVTDHMT